MAQVRQAAATALGAAATKAKLLAENEAREVRHWSRWHMCED